MLRLLLAVAVVCFHTGSMAEHFLISADNAVHVFFIISGFYMAMILTEKYGFEVKGLKAFALNRLLRIYPTYYAALAGVILWQLLCHWTSHGHAPPHPLLAMGALLPWWGRVLLVLPNFTLLGIDLPFLFNYAPTTGLAWHANNHLDPGVSWLGLSVLIGPAWSIGSELCFYLLAPFAAKGAGCRAVLLLGASLLVSLVLKRYFQFETYFFWPANFFMFAMGMLAHKWGGRLATRVVHRVRSGWGRWAFVGFAWFWIMGIPATRHALPDAVLLASAMGLIPFMFAVTKSSKWDRFLGDLSYPLYCIHMLLFEVCRTILGRFHGHWNLFSPMVLVTSLAAAVLLYWYVDRIVEHLRIRVVARLGGL